MAKPEKTMATHSLTMMSMQFENAYTNLIREKDYDPWGDTVFYVKDLTMIDRRTHTAVARVNKTEAFTRLLVTPKWSYLFQGVYIIVPYIPTGEWTNAEHAINIHGYSEKLGNIYGSDEQPTEKGMKMLNIREHMIMYEHVFGDVIKCPITEWEILLVVDAKLQNTESVYITRLRDIIYKIKDAENVK